MKQQTAEKLYEKSKKLIYKICHKMAAQYSVPFEDVLSQAHLLFVETYEDYDAEFGAKFTTWLQCKLQWRLHDWLKKEYRARAYLELNEEIVGMYVPQQVFLKDLLHGLSDEAKLIVRMILKTPRELNALFKWNKVYNRSTVLSSTIEHLEVLGWQRSEIRSGIEELRFHINNPPTKEPKVKRPPALKKAGFKNRGEVYLILKKHGA